MRFSLGSLLETDMAPVDIQAVSPLENAVKITSEI